MLTHRNGVADHYAARKSTNKCTRVSTQTQKYDEKRKIVYQHFKELRFFMKSFGCPTCFISNHAAKIDFDYSTERIIEKK